MSSRAALNAKLVKRHQQRQAATQARTNTNKFSQKQSHYELRREEEQARQVQQHNVTSFLTGDANNGAAGNESNAAAAASVRQVGDGLLRSRWGSEGNANSTGAQQWSPMRLQSQPLSRHALQGNHQNNGGVTNAKKAAAATGSTRDGHLFVGGSVARPRRNTTTTTTTNADTHTRMSADATHAGQRSLMKPRSAKADHLSTRSTRRLSRFQLSEDNTNNNNDAMDALTQGGEDDDDAMEEKGQTGNAPGQRRARTLTSSATEQENEEEEGEPPRKLTKQEKFYEVIANSKQQRAQQQRERQDRDEVTKELDAEINALMHLLPRRDPEEEERSAFVQSGNAEVRALLAQYKKNHIAKQVSLKASGEAVITPLAQVKSTMSAKNVQREEEVAKKKAQGTSSVTAITTAEHTYNTNKKDHDEEEDDFDAMLQRMSLDPRRAHATERLLDEAEVAAQALQQQVLQEDRQALPRLALQEKEQLQQTRREWLREGGNAAVQMDDLDKEIHNEGEEGEGEGNDAFSDNADLPSSYEGDSEEDKHTTAEEEEDDEDEEDEKEEEGEEKNTTRSGEAAVAALLSATHTHNGLDKLLSALEALVHTNDTTTTAEKETNTHLEEKEKNVIKSTAELEAEYGTLVRALYRYATQHLLEVVQVFRALLIEAEKEFLHGARRPPSRAVLLYLHTATLLFPASDFRHAVMTPLLLFLCSTLAQLKLTTWEDVHGAVWLSALLVQCLRNGCNKFCAEVIVSLLNILALQLPRGVLEPARFQTLRVPFPLLDRCEPALLSSTTTSKDKTNEKGNEEGRNDEKETSVPDFTHGPLPIGLLDTNYDAEALLLSAYRLLYELADMYRTVPAFATMLSEPFDALDALLTRNTNGEEGCMSRAVCAAHTTLRTRLHEYAQEAKKHRTPLAMRSFRPRPLRQYDPLLAETAEHAVRSETKELKRGLREDKKRLVRHLKAEATVQRRAYEKESALVAAQRERQYHVVLGQLQAQQHAMNTVDAMMAKAKSKPRKGLSGAPKTAGAEDASGGGGAMGNE